ncbi:uncharacterized protein LOC131825576 [Mustela lutreola]|uniref:uncharacterized protein LOC131825576 n=1 Tax=Mustela lutreola TaxID=9666 RepID=UPI0027976EAC|nr:uncharacterized protein LOC131825576 [Mustela lutreola]
MTPPCVPSVTSPNRDAARRLAAHAAGGGACRREAGLVARGRGLSPGDPPAGCARFPAGVSVERLLANALTRYLPRTSVARKGSLRLRAPRALEIVWPRLGETRCRGEPPVVLCDAAAGFSNSDSGSSWLHRPRRASGPGPDRPLPAPAPYSWRAFEEYAECENAKLLKAFGSLPKDRGRYQGSLRVFVTPPASTSGSKVIYQTEMYGKLKEDMLRKRTQKMIK